MGDSKFCEGHDAKRRVFARPDVNRPQRFGVAVHRLPTGQAQLSFRNNYDLETGPGSDGFDGGVLEIKIGSGSFTDIIAAGGSFASGGYTHTIDGGYGNALAGRPAWSGTSSGLLRPWRTCPLPLPVRPFNCGGDVARTTAMAARAGA